MVMLPIKIKNSWVAAVLLLLVMVQSHLFAQDTLAVNMDNDAILDKVWVNFQDDDAYINVALSSSKQIIRSKPLGDPSGTIVFKKAKNGFHYKVNFMRSGYAVQFRFRKDTKRMEAIGLSRYSFGNAANDGSGESSVNLNTNSYIGNWHYYDHEKEELIGMAPIKKIVNMGTKYLSDFNGLIISTFMDKCGAWYDEERPKYN